MSRNRDVGRYVESESKLIRRVHSLVFDYDMTVQFFMVNLREMPRDAKLTCSGELDNGKFVLEFVEERTDEQ